MSIEDSCLRVHERLVRGFIETSLVPIYRRRGDERLGWHRNDVVGVAKVREKSFINTYVSFFPSSRYCEVYESYRNVTVHRSNDQTRTQRSSWIREGTLDKSSHRYSVSEASDGVTSIPSASSAALRNCKERQVVENSGWLIFSHTMRPYLDS
ncbi:hypothetical protein RB195_011721 [Necator americanus]|uniref:Uncharacterized protein n=1 Tax=Necator americanus TaxID=51031 RepID=A0ABR1D3Q3_NECAM